ncbi:MAG: hypothetical protein SV775_07205 [Thermodesulfobacteriota bacterium]|nr:hypothetical protein [Thermodesulfobacteriota bacterium]
MHVNQERIEKYLNDIVTETKDLHSVLEQKEELILQDQNFLRSINYSTIVISEAIVSTIQHIPAKKHNVVFRAYAEAFGKAKKFQIVPKYLIEWLESLADFEICFCITTGGLMMSCFWKTSVPG